jgi:hypothetical protein
LNVSASASTEAEAGRVTPALTFVHHCSVFKEPLPEARRPTLAGRRRELGLTPIPLLGSPDGAPMTAGAVGEDR